MRTVLLVAAICCGGVCVAGGPETQLVSAGFESQAPVVPSGAWVQINSRYTSLQRQADGSYWRWSPPSQHHNAAVRINAGQYAGSGVCIATTNGSCFVLTNKHVVESNRSIKVSWLSGTTASGTVVASRPAGAEDIALVHVPRPPQGWIGLPLSNREPPIGCDLELVGFGGPKFGTKRSFFGKRLQADRLRIDAATISGDSGSGMLWNCCIVGVNYGGPSIPTTMAGVELVYPASSGVTPSFLVRWVTQYCQPYGCQPQIADPYSGANSGGFYNPPTTPVAPTIPTQPIAQPTTPTQPTTPDPQKEIVIVSPADLEAIKKEIADGIKPGPQGPPGPPGPQGPPGNTATITEADLETIAQMVLDRLPTQRPSLTIEEIKRQLPPIYPQWIDKDGDVIDSLPNGVRLGETLPLRIDVVLEDARSQ